MDNRYFNHIVYGGDYNPDQWKTTPEIWDEDMRLMKLAHINSASVGIFSWASIEPEEGVYNFEWLDIIMDKCAENGIDVILATPSGARPAWLAQKYPEVLRVEENGIRNEFGVRHNHCLTSPLYREKVREINTVLAKRYGKHPALKMWHISNEYSGCCHCELCQEAFREWLKKHYDNDLEKLNHEWWTGFWSHNISDWSQISSPKSRGENHVTSLKNCWQHFVSDSHISFFENEIAPLREITPDVPVTANFMGLYDEIDYSEFAKHVDIASWDNYPFWENSEAEKEATKVAFIHDLYRSFKDGKPFFLMESTPSNTNWHPVNKLPPCERTEQTSIQAVAYGADSVQYFQWRKGRNGHEKYHGAVVDHEGSENTRVFKGVAHIGEVLEKLDGVVGGKSYAKVAVIYDWQNKWAVKNFCGYNNQHRDYNEECIKWYKPFYDRGIVCDVISEDDDFSKYDLIIAPFLYLLKDGLEDKIASFVENGGAFVSTYLFAVVNKNDMVYYGGLPAGKLRNVFGIWAEETDAIPAHTKETATFNGKEYDVNHICDIIHTEGAEVLGEYKTDFYAGEPSVTVNRYGKGLAYCAAFRNDGEFADDFCAYIIKKLDITSCTDIGFDKGLAVRKRGDFTFILNFTEETKKLFADREYTDAVTGNRISGEIEIPKLGYIILR